MRDQQKRTSELYNRWGVSRTYRPIMFLQVPVFIALMESLRGMSGNNSGIFAWLFSLIEPSQDPASAGQPLHLTVEPTFANEGALWFPDLLAGDPTGVLPALLTVSILSNVMLGWKTKSLRELSELPKLQMYQEATFRGLRVFVQALACYVGLAGFASEMPTALLLYWITSTNVATLQTWILENKVFSQPMLYFFEKRYVAFNKPGVDDPFQLKNMR
jgi:inner membrane protein COX18